MTTIVSAEQPHQVRRSGGVPWIRAIKHEVNIDSRPGRFLLTGSARLPGLREIPDLLPGRTETIERLVNLLAASTASLAARAQRLRASR